MCGICSLSSYIYKKNINDNINNHWRLATHIFRYMQKKSIFIFYQQKKEKRCRITICVYKEERSFNELPTHAACSFQQRCAAVIYVKSIYSSVLVKRKREQVEIPIQIFIV